MKKYILPISLVILVGLVVLVSALTDQDNIEVSANVEKGWNLISNGIFAINPSQDSEIQKEDISAIYYYDSNDKEYKLVFPLGELSHDEEEEIEDVIMKEIAPAVWIYSKKSGNLKFTTDDVVPLNQRPLSAGWNFVSITPSMDRKSLNDLKGTCSILDAYTWDSKKVDWYKDSKYLDAYFDQNWIGLGVIIKVSSNCKLGTSSSGSTTQPPQIPNTNECTDTDDGKDYYTKGTASGIKLGADYFETYEDTCISGDEEGRNLKEGFCTNNKVTFEFYKCLNGCSDGACIQ